MLSKYLTTKKLFSYAFVLSIAIGCSWQFFSLVNFYLSYPTKIEIDTSFDSFEDTLPALTFCKNVGQRNYGKYSADLFKNYSFEEMVKEVNSNKFYSTNVENDPKLMLNTVGEKLSLIYYCLTLNGNNLEIFWNFS